MQDSYTKSLKAITDLFDVGPNHIINILNNAIRLSICKGKEIHDHVNYEIG